MANKEALGKIGLIIAAAAGAALLGLADAATISATDTLAPSGSRQALLMLADGASLGLLGALAALPLLLVPQLRGPWPGFLWGVLIAAVADRGEWWFTTPPSFVAQSTAEALRGNALVFLLAFVALVAVFFALSVRLRRPRLRAGVILMITFFLASRMIAARRDLPSLGVPAPDALSVMLITSDTTRADYIGAYGDSTMKTPRFDALAAQGALFEEAYSQIPVTGPSHTTLFTGQAPWEHGALLNGVSVNPNVEMMAEHLRKQGWRTGAFVSAYVLEGKLGFSRGFEVYDDDFSWLQGWASTLPGRLSAAFTRRFNPEHVLERRGGRTVDQALDWLGGIEEKPFFVWVHLFDPHGPYAPPPPWDTAYYQGDPRDPAHTSMSQVEGVASYLKPTLEGITDVEWVRAQYAGEVSYADEQLGRLLDWLDETGRADSTLVVIAGDHGESLGEHNVWFNHGDDLFEPSTKVPLAMRLPGSIPAGTAVSVPVELTDVAPTIYELLKLDPPSTVKGAPLTETFTNPYFYPRPEARGLTFDRQANLAARKAGEITAPIYRMMSLRKPGSFLFVYRDAPGLENALYDLSDGGTDQDPPVDNPGLSRALAETAHSYILQMTSADLARSGQELDEETRQKLEALGYIE